VNIVILGHISNDMYILHISTVGHVGRPSMVSEELRSYSTEEVPEYSGIQEAGLFELVEQFCSSEGV